MTKHSSFKLTFHKYSKYIIILIILFLSFLFSGIVYIRNIGRELETYSYVASVLAHLESYDKTSFEDFKTGFKTSFKTDWTHLDSRDYDWLAIDLSKSDSIDRGSLNPSLEKILLDSWGNRIMIAGRKINEEKVEFIVWSKGPDGISGTSDDISRPKIMPEELKNKPEN